LLKRPSRPADPPSIRLRPTEFPSTVRLARINAQPSLDPRKMDVLKSESFIANLDPILS